MRVLVVGGSGSGKSAYAEQLAARLSERRTYVATMRPEGREARARIDRHRLQRAGLGFDTVECPDSLAPAFATDRGGVVLVDDLGNLVANALFLPDGTMTDPGEVLERLYNEVKALARAYDHVVLVGNEVGAEGRYDHDSTNAWVRLIGALNCRIAATFDVVTEVVCGIPCQVKGVWA
ncbi:MAG: bifunctional adenosylcobinamide kinase/adenosylcobinamide-phosphate guanylyltransferase [Atopobiaceae bacterium]|nr:bifunctional adenosylcobinamide kinase/adenosylcobinamide-phosphate guanylyltransferase [Atopobiaceae bacterium]